MRHFFVILTFTAFSAECRQQEGRAAISRVKLQEVVKFITSALGDLSITTFSLNT